MKKHLLSVFSICLLLLLWQLFATSMNQPALIPSVPELLKTLSQLLGMESFYQSVVATLFRGIAGMFISLIGAVITALLLARHPVLYELFRPILSIMRSIPVISFILLGLIFLNPEILPLLIAFLTMYPLLTENLTKGISNLRPGLTVMARLFTINRRNKLIQVVYPQVKPYLFSGLSSAAGFGWRAIIMGEVLAQCSLGIGGEMKRAQNFIAVPELIAWTLIAVAISFLFDKWIGRIGQKNGRVLFKRGSRSNKTRQERLGGIPVKCSGISFQYDNTRILSNYSYTFDAAQIYGITAPSGTGKTTLLNLINGTLSPCTGKVDKELCQGIASVFQEPELLPQLTVLQNVTFPLASVLNRPQAEQDALQILKEMEIQDLCERYPDELSFGQQQRVAIARALVYPSPLLLMDEPFKGLDASLAHRIIIRIRERQTVKKQTIIFTSHDPDNLKLFADTVIDLRERVNQS